MFRPVTAAVSVAALTLALTGCTTNSTPPEKTPIGQSLGVSLKADAAHLMGDLQIYQAENGAYPTVPAQQLAGTLGTMLSSGTTVASYTGSQFCLTHTPGNEWLVYDMASSSSQIGSGTQCGVNG